jgi:hypothetical protein
MGESVGGYGARSKNCEKRLLKFHQVLSVRKERLCSHWTDFNEIWYLKSFPKYVDKIQVIEI